MMEAPDKSEESPSNVSASLSLLQHLESCHWVSYLHAEHK